MGQTTAVSPEENLDQIQNYNWHQSQFKLFSVLKQVQNQTYSILTEYIFIELQNLCY